MAEKDFERAKILEKPGDKRAEAPNQAASPDAAKVNSVVPATNKPAAGAQTEDHGGSFDGIIGRFTGKGKGTVIWTSPYDMYLNGAFNGLYKATVDTITKDIQGLVITTIFHAYLLIGYYLLAVFFDNDESKAFSKNPYKETSLNDLAKRDDIPFARQKLTDCIKAAAVDMELNKYAQ